MSIVYLVLACSSPPESAPAPKAVEAPVPPGPSEVEGEIRTGPHGIQLGEWNGRFETRGGPLHFRFRVGPNCETTLLVAEQEFPTRARCEEGSLSMRFPPYLGSLTARIGASGDTLAGQYDFQRGGEWHHLTFAADRSTARTFIETPAEAPTSVSLSVNGNDPVLLEMQGTEAGRVHASVSAPTGDWGPLEGGWTDAGLELSGFDGSHGFLMRIAPDDEGRMVGKYWSKTSTARELVETPANADLDGWDALELASVDLAGLSLKRIGGEEEPLPTAGPRIVHFTGSWCPNCNDAAPVLEAVAKDFPGITVLGLSWEAGAPAGKAERQIRQFRDRHGVTHPLYRLDSAPPFLDPVPAWPTTLFVADDGTVTAAHVGFLGPSTGERYRMLVERYQAEAKRLSGG